MTAIALTEDVVRAWHAEAWAGLEARVSAGVLPQALLVTGQEGIGKSRFATALARRLLAGPDADEDLMLSAFPDFTAVAPEEAGKPIVVDQIRALGAFFALTPARGGFKVAIIEPAEAMNVNAANALLKTLEEPPPRSLLILVSERPQRLLATIRSRCQRVPLQAPALEAARAWLDPILSEGRDAGLALALARGGPRLAAARAAADDDLWAAQAIETLRSVVSGGIGPLAAAADLGQESPLRAVELVLLFLESLLKQSFSIDQSSDSAPFLMPDLTVEFHRIHLESAFAAYAVTLDYYDTLRRGASLRPLAVLEDICEALAAAIPPAP